MTELDTQLERLGMLRTTAPPAPFERRVRALGREAMREPAKGGDAVIGRTETTVIVSVVATYFVCAVEGVVSLMMMS